MVMNKLVTLLILVCFLLPLNEDTVRADESIPFGLLLSEPSPAGSIEEEEKPFNEFEIGDILDVILHGDLWLYHIRTNNVYHTDGNAAFTELTARFGADFRFKEIDWFTGQLRAVRTEVHGRPDKWTAPARDDAGDRVDLANFTISGELGTLPTSLTVGIQELGYGDGLLIFDGYTDKRAVWTTPIRSFPAVKWNIKPHEDISMDFFAAQFHNDHVSYETYLGSGVGVQGGGQVYGSVFNYTTDSVGCLEIGLFLKDEDIRDGHNNGLDTGSNTWALSLRESKDLGSFNLTAEIIKEWGRTRVVQNSVAPNSPLQSRDAWGGHVSGTYSFTMTEESPYLKARFAYFQGDRSGTSSVESFDPFFYGFNDWGSWFLGDMTSYSLTNTNEQAISLEFGMVPFDKSKLRVFLYDFNLDQEMPFSHSKAWSNEANIVFDYFPCDYIFLGAMAGAVIPKAAAESFNGDDEIQTEVMFWAGFYF